MSCIAANTTFASRVKDAREGRGLSIPEAADAAGIDAVTWWRVEAGRTKNPRLDTAQAIAAVLDLRLGSAHDLDGTPPVAPCGESSDTEARRPTLASVEGETGSKHEGA